MEDAKRKSNRGLSVQWGFERSRLEGPVMASAYEHVLPIIRAAPSGSLGGRAKVGSNGWDEVRSAQQKYATGA